MQAWLVPPYKLFRHWLPYSEVLLLQLLQLLQPIIYTSNVAYPSLEVHSMD